MNQTNTVSPNNLFIRNSLWVQFTSFFIRGVNSIAMLLILRWLAPDEYGVFSMGLIVLSITDLIKDFGLLKFLIQTTEDLKLSANVVFWLNSASVTIIYAIIYFLTPLITDYFRTPALGKIMPLMMVIILISPLSSVHIALLTRKQRFDQLSIINIVSSLGYSVLGIVLVLVGFSYWALIFSRLFSALLQIILCWRYEPWRPQRQFDVNIARSMLAFGGWVSIESIVGWVQAQANNIFAGRFFGSAELALYDVGYKYGILLYSEMISPLARVIYPFLCSLAHNIASLRKAYLKLQHMISLLLWPITVFLYFSLPEILLIVLGNQWQESIEIVKLILIAGAGASFVMPNFELWRSQGNPQIGSIYVIIRSMIAIPLYYWVTVNYSIYWMAFAYTAMIGVNMFVHAFLVSRSLEMSYFRYFRVIIPGLLASSITFVLLSSLFYFVTGPELTFVIIRFILGGILTLAGIFAVGYKDVIDLIQRILGMVKEFFTHRTHRSNDKLSKEI